MNNLKKYVFSPVLRTLFFLWIFYSLRNGIYRTNRIAIHECHTWNYYTYYTYYIACWVIDMSREHNVFIDVDITFYVYFVTLKMRLLSKIVRIDNFYIYYALCLFMKPSQLITINNKPQSGCRQRKYFNYRILVF